MFETFIVFKSLVENNVGKNRKALKSYNGGEYIKREFQWLFASEGIQMRHLVPYTPQQNGVAKRKNRYLKEMATFLDEARDITSYMWAEVLNCASYIHNIVPHNFS